MKIDGIDVSEYGVKQWNLMPEYSEISNESEWINGAAVPVMLKGTTGFKKMKVNVMIQGSDRQDIWQRAGAFIALLMAPREIQFDGFAHYFYMYLSNASQAETSLQRFHKATLELIGYEYGAQREYTTTARTLVVQNEGNILTPAVVEVVPVINLASVTLTGLVRNPNTGADKNIVISNLTNGKSIVIDGETGLVTESGANKFADVELWDLPTLLPGNNTITVDKDIKLIIRHKPRFL